MVNYTAIADAAAGYADYQTAFSAMSIEMGATTFGDLSPNSLKMWAATYPADYLTLHNGTDAISLLALSMIGSAASRLVVSDADIHGFINALPITQGAIDGLYYMATRTNKAWPNLSIATVKKAFEMRERGDI